MSQDLDTTVISERVIALQECEQRLSLLIEADRHKLQDVAARDKSTAAIAKAKLAMLQN